MSGSPFKDVARITLIMGAAFTIAICFQVYVKVSSTLAYKARGERFQRYHSQDPVMTKADRLVGNLVEWGFVFWPLLFSLALAVSATDDDGQNNSHYITAAYVYALSRLMYVLVGITCTRFHASGDATKTPLILFTAPAYVCLMYMTYELVLLAL